MQLTAPGPDCNFTCFQEQSDLLEVTQPTGGRGCFLPTLCPIQRAGRPAARGTRHEDPPTSPPTRLLCGAWTSALWPPHPDSTLESQAAGSTLPPGRSHPGHPPLLAEQVWWLWVPPCLPSSGGSPGLECPSTSPTHESSGWSPCVHPTTPPRHPQHPASLSSPLNSAGRCSTLPWPQNLTLAAHLNLLRSSLLGSET